MATTLNHNQQALLAQLAAAQNQSIGSSTSTFPPMINWSPSPATTATAGIVSFPPIVGSSTVRERSKRQEALASLANAPSRKLDKVSMHYKHVSPDIVINTMGKFPPVMNHRPTRWIMHLLCCASAPHKFPGQLQYRHAGLTFVAQANPLGKFCKMRLTVAGYELLAHYANNKKFKPFFDAFVSKTAKDEIYSACFDFEMNALPEFIKKDGLLLAERMAKKDAAAINNMRQMAQTYAVYHQQPIYTSTSTATSAVNPALLNTGMLLSNSQSYANMINSQVPQANSLAYTIASQIRQGAGKLRVTVNMDHVYVTDSSNTQHLVWKP